MARSAMDGAPGGCVIRAAPGGGVVAVWSLALLAALLTVLPAAPAAAQLPPTLLSGQRVRVTPVEGRRLEGRIAFVTPIRLGLRTTARDPVEWDAVDIRRIERHAGLERRFGRTVLLSSLVGGTALGGTIYFLSSGAGSSRGASFARGFGVGAGIGAVFGVVLGTVQPHDRWVQVYLVADGGMAVGASLPWPGIR